MLVLIVFSDVGLNLYEVLMDVQMTDYDERFVELGQESRV